ncbi:MAG: response regulator transcription factor [Actinomycetota bacterium]|nr:response regulator transcription factor [Actinomycetota bacterium]
MGAAPPDPEGLARAPGATILVVEDEPDLVWLLRFNLESEGYRTFVARNGEAALELLLRERPDLMLLDLMMPVMDGWALLDELQASGGSRPRVIVVSARTAQDDRLRAARYGVEGFVAKPFDMDELLAMIRELVPRRPS